MHTYTFIIYTLFFSIFFSSFFIYWSCYSLFWINCSDVHVCSMWNLLGFNSLCQDAAGGGTASAQLMVVQDVGQLLHPLSCQRAAEIIELCDKFINESSWPRWPPLPPVQREPAENLWDGWRCVISVKERKKRQIFDVLFHFFWSFWNDYGLLMEGLQAAVNLVWPEICVSCLSSADRAEPAGCYSLSAACLQQQQHTNPWVPLRKHQHEGQTTQGGRKRGRISREKCVLMWDADSVMLWRLLLLWVDLVLVSSAPLSCSCDVVDVDSSGGEVMKGWRGGEVLKPSLRLAVVYIYPVEPNLCDEAIVTDSILGEYMVDEKTSIHWLVAILFGPTHTHTHKHRLTHTPHTPLLALCCQVLLG